MIINNDGFVYDHTNGFFHSYFEDKYHLWTIQDAKDGDVLACENGWTCIYKCLNDNLFSSHCFMDNEGWFCEEGGQAHTLDNEICGEIYPATKEQRDLLFAKIREAGYEWNPDKKELKKIEQKPALSANKEKNFINAIINSLDKDKLNRVWGISFEEVKSWLKSISPQKQWKPSEEQLRELRCVISGCSFETPILIELEQDLKKLL